MASQLTVRGVPEEVSRRLEALSKERGKSINATVLAILEEALGTEKRRERLQRYVTWNQDDLRQFEEALCEQRTIEVELWK